MPAKELTDEKRIEILQRIGKVLEQLRERKELTQQEIADLLGIPRSGVSLLEDGKRGLDAAEILKLSEVYKKSPDELLEKGKKEMSESNYKFNQINLPPANNSRMSENRTVQADSLYTPVENVLRIGEDLGFNIDPKVDVKKAPLLNSRTADKSPIIELASITFRGDMSDEIARRQAMSWVDTIENSYPASKPHIDFNVHNIQGTHQIKFITAH